MDSCIPSRLRQTVKHSTSFSMSDQLCGKNEQKLQVQSTGYNTKVYLPVFKRVIQIFEEIWVLCLRRVKKENIWVVSVEITRDACGL